MVDRPKLTPQAGRGGGGSGVPTIPRTQQTDFRRLPTVQPTGLEAEARMLGVQANMFGALQREFQITANEGIAQIKAEQQVEAEKQYSQGRLLIEEQLAKIDLNPEASENLTDSTLGAYDDIADKTIQSAKSSFQRRILEDKFARGRLPVGQRAVRNQALREVAQRDADFAEKLNTNQQLIAANPDTYLDTVEEQMQSIADLPIGDEEKIEVAKETLEAFSASRIKGLIKQNPEQAVVALQDEVFTATMSDTLVAAAREDAELAIKKEVAEAEVRESGTRAQNLLEAEEAAAEGNLLNTEVADLVEAGDLLPEQGIDLVEQIQQADARAEEDFMSTKKVLDAINGQDVLTGGDGRKINDAYKKAIAPTVSAMEPQDALKSKLRFVSQTNKIPSLMKSEIKAQLKGGSASQKLDSARLVRAIQEESPVASVADLSKEDHALADRYMDLLDAGIPEEDVLATIERQDSMVNQGTSEIRGKEFKKLFDEDTAVQNAIGEFDTLFTFEPGVTTETGTRTRLIDDAKALAESYYKDNPDIGKAMEYAQKNIRRTYGVTKTGGSGSRLMKYAPENFYDVDGNTEWIGAQLEEDINELELGIPSSRSRASIPADVNAIFEMDQRSDSLVLTENMINNLNKIGNAPDDEKGALVNAVFEEDMRRGDDVLSDKIIDKLVNLSKLTEPDAINSVIEEFAEDQFDADADGRGVLVNQNFIDTMVEIRENPSRVKPLVNSIFEADQRLRDSLLTGDMINVLNRISDNSLPQNSVDQIKPIDRNNVFLVPDARTAREASNGTPSYQVIIKNEDGTLRSAKGRWQPDPTNQVRKAKKERQTRAQEKLADVRQSAERRRGFRAEMSKPSLGEKLGKRTAEIIKSKLEN